MRRSSGFKNSVMAAIFTALLCICSQIQIPLPLVPISLALFGINLTGALLGPKYGAVSVTLYILLGAVGVPVFSSFTSGLGILLGPTGGYILGYLLDVVIIGVLCRRQKKLKFWRSALAMAVGTLACYVFGTIWFMYVTKMGLVASLTYCVIPFIPGDIIKIALASVLALRLAPLMGEARAR